LEIPALNRAVLSKPPFEPVSAKLAYLASGFNFFTWIFRFGYWILNQFQVLGFILTPDF